MKKITINKSLKTNLIYHLFYLFLCLQLAACGTLSHKISHGGGDYAPDFNIDVSKVPDAVPKLEPLSKYGNPRSYVACGHRYYVMKSSYGYDEKGIASWYGMKFHKIRTSSGELYDVAKMTAASKTLPLPTYCLVTNLQSGRHVIVKVNDRGPFVANRIIDLSYVAAVKLGVTAHGTALVEVKAIDPRCPADVTQTPVCTAMSPHPCVPRIYLQLGAFSVCDNAQRLANQIHSCVSYPVMITTSNRGGQTLYRVQIGPVPSVDCSDEIYERLKDLGLGKPITVVQ
jgi:rare lipoprotein A